MAFQIVYKVVRRSPYDDSLMSAKVYDTIMYYYDYEMPLESSSICLNLKYKLNKFIKPNSELLTNGYGIFVFEDLEDAKKWVRINPNLFIYKAQANGIIRKLPKMLVFTSEIWPKGTVMTTSLKLLKEVKI